MSKIIERATKDGGTVWRVTWRDVSGRQLSETFENKADAEACAAVNP